MLTKAQKSALIEAVSSFIEGGEEGQKKAVVLDRALGAIDAMEQREKEIKSNFLGVKPEWAFYCSLKMLSCFSNKSLTDPIGNKIKPIEKFLKKLNY